LTRFSVIVPTFQRRDTVLRTVSALEQQSERDFEVIVVDDGSSDGSAEALRTLDVSFPLRVIEQPNQGAAAARNAGVEASSGELVAFLDDDMRADPALLAEHDRSHGEGADMVMGDMPLDPASPHNLLSWGVGSWAAGRRKRLSAPGAEIRIDDLLTGQMSISRAAYLAVGGLDPTFTRDGLFGGEDLDFGHRVLAAGYEIAFNPAAISYQYYDVDPAKYLRRARETGRSDRELVAKHPELAGAMGASPSFKTRRSRLLLSPFVVAPAILSWPLRAGAAALARSGLNTPRVRHLFFAVRTMEYLRGARLAGRGGAR
jgi:glycosyltransferase involved in cell wall biosynthesis